MNSWFFFPFSALKRSDAQLLHRHSYGLPRVPEECQVAEPVPGRQANHIASFSVRHGRECRVVEVPRAGRGNCDLHRGHVTRHGTPLGTALRADGDDLRRTCTWSARRSWMNATNG